MTTESDQTQPLREETKPETVQSGWRRFAFRLMVIVFSFGATVLLCEGALWLVAPVPYHEWIVWEPEGHIRARPTPNQRLYTAEGHLVRINKYGFRGPDYDYYKKPGTLRMEVFGGSAGFCFRVSGRENTWPFILEQLLSERLKMPVEVINLALPGYDVFNSKLNYLCFGRAFHPDAILVYHTWNDMKMFRFLAKTPYGNSSWVPNKPLWQRIARATQIGRRARQFIWNATKRKMENKFRKVEGKDVGIDAPIDPKAIQWERQNFVDFVRMAHAGGHLPILVSQASLGTPENINEQDIRMEIAYVVEGVGMSIPLMMDTWLKINKIIEQVAKENNAIFVNGYDAVPHDLEHMRDVVHFLDPGSRKLAEAIADTLLSDQRFLDLVERVRAETKSPDESG